jgi:hypothetical protein
MTETDTNISSQGLQQDEYELWRYWISLEKRMIVTDQFCSIHEQNKAAFSSEYAQIILLSAVHFESCAKILINKYGGSDPNKKNMGTMRAHLMEQRCGIAQLELKLFPSVQVIQPLKEWSEDTGANWWIEYNEIKHNFDSSRERATQDIALNALSGCLVILLYLLEGKMDQIQPHSHLILYDRPKYYVGPSRLKLP